MDAPREIPFQGAQGAARRLLRGAVDEIGDGLRLRQVQLAVEEGPLGELAGPRQARAQFQYPLLEHVQHHGPAMALQFQDILTSEGAWRGKIKGDAVIQHTPVAGVEGQIGGVARRRTVAQQGLGDGGGGGPGDPHDAHAAASRRGGNGGDGVAGSHHTSPLTPHLSSSQRPFRCGA